VAATPVGTPADSTRPARAVASGQPIWAERHRLHNALVLFNPAPVT
jgi:galactarate dehydratase